MSDSMIEQHTSNLAPASRGGLSLRVSTIRNARPPMQVAVRGRSISTGIEEGWVRKHRDNGSRLPALALKSAKRSECFHLAAQNVDQERLLLS